MTGTTAVTGTALLVHVFLDADAVATAGTPAQTCLTALWEAVCVGLGMTGGVAGNSIDLDTATLTATAAGFTCVPRSWG